VESRAAKLAEIVKKVPGTAIVYCRTRKKTREYCSLLQREGINASFYHAGLEREERRERQEQWIRNETRVMVCTNAFGMGIDKPDVRLVVHTEPPECLESYYQEAGRAGRDGKKAYAVLLYHQTDLGEMAGLAEMRYPPMATIRKVYQALANYLQLPSGIGEDASFPLDIQDLSLKFKLPVVEVIHSLKAMQQGGIVDYQEQLFLAPTVQFIAGKDALSAFEEMNPGTSDIIKTLLRSYGGIFEHPVSISERQMARSLWKDVPVIEKQLSFLHARGIIRYAPRSDSPRLRFLQDRVRAEDLYIEPVSYLKRKAVFAARVEAMTRYMTGPDCRAKFIGQYFGDDEIRACGICDRCLYMKRTAFSSADFRQMEGEIRKLLESGDMAANDLMGRMKGIDTEKFWKLLAYLEEEETIGMTGTGMVTIRGKKKGPG
jgi:ATP-dependent DNA helicase RecQ